MVRIYLKRRFTRARMSHEVAEKALELFGSLHNFQHSKVIHSHLCYLKDKKLHQIRNQATSFKCPEDWWALNFLRTYSDVLVTTGRILRDEPDAFEVPFDGPIYVRLSFK